VRIGFGNLPANFRPGDWMCECSAHNYSKQVRAFPIYL
jgi:hypothetical protein